MQGGIYKPEDRKKNITVWGVRDKVVGSEKVEEFRVELRGE